MSHGPRSDHGIRTVRPLEDECQLAGARAVDAQLAAAARVDHAFVPCRLRGRSRTPIGRPGWRLRLCIASGSGTGHRPVASGSGRAEHWRLRRPIARPLGDWALKLRRAGIPAQVSYHAGTFLCNAALYLSCHTAHIRKLKTKSAFIHVPLDTSQTAGQLQDMAALPAAVAAAGLRLILDELAQPKPRVA